jgi:signal transduction histidine kinase/ligand-binding sensor domain-containing protein
MWFATKRGVAIYDGFDWEGHGKEDGLPSADLRWLRFDEDGVPWVLCSDQGLALARWSGEDWVAMPSMPVEAGNRLSAVNSSGLVIDSVTGRAFVATTRGLFRFDGERWSWFGGDSWCSIEDFLNLLDLHEDSEEGRIEAVFGLTRNGRDLFIGSKSGLRRLPLDRPDGEPPAIQHLLAEPVYGLKREGTRVWVVGKNRVGWISGDEYHPLAAAIGLSDLGKESVLVEGDGRGGVWFASWRLLGRVLNNGDAYHVLRDDPNPSLAERRFVQGGNFDLHGDREGNMWVACVQGVNKIVNSPFTSLNMDSGLFADEVTAVLERRSGEIVLGHGGGLTFLEPDLRVVESRDIGGGGWDGRVMGLAEDERDSLWVATSGHGLLEIGAAGEERWHHPLRVYEDDSHGIDDNGIASVNDLGAPVSRRPGRKTLHCILVEGEAFWVGTSHGLLRLRLQEDGTSEFEEVLLGGANYSIRRLAAARSGALLVGTAEGGVFRLGGDGEQQQWSSPVRSHRSVFSLYEKEDGALWLGTEAGLMTVVDGELRPTQDPDPVIDYTVYFIEPASPGTYWFGTDAGVVRWSEGVQNRFGPAQGLAGFETNRDAGCVDRDGRMWIGTDHGVSLHIPDQRSIDSRPTVELVSVDAGEGKVALGPARTSIEARGDSLNFGFRAISFVDEDHLRFRYKLEGSERYKEWAGPEHLATRERSYSGLPPGDYRFSIQAIDVNDRESDIVDSSVITIPVPFYERTWVITAEVLLGLGFLGFLFARAISMQRAKEAEEASRTKDEFLASVSHELRTPLNAIMGLSEALQEEVYGSLTLKQASSLNIIETSARKLLGQINNVIDLSRIATRKIKLERQELDVELSCKQAIHHVRPEAEAKHQEISFEVEGPHSIVSADPARVRQILDNLLENAVKFSPEEAGIRVGVATFPEEAMVEISVLNERSFIPPEELKDLFTPFLQLDGGLSRMHGGTGLGLVLVQRLTEMHGGRVEVESTEEEGTRFTVALPMELVVSSR